jgi:hypothetical protein
MKTFTSSLLVNRLLTSLFTLALIHFTGVAVASTDNQSNINRGNQSISSGIEYASLTATATSKSVFINWVTASEQNNSYFEVERSSDMKVFKTVALVLDGFAATGTSNGKSYKFKEDAGDVRKGKTVYYRLKQIGTDNLVHYSEVMAVQMNATIIVFPKQDATGIKSFNSNFNESSVTETQMADAANQILLSKQSTISTVYTSISDERLNDLSSGILKGCAMMSETMYNNTKMMLV